MIQPVAAFDFTPSSGKSPLTVKFTDKSTGSPTAWAWDFGDGFNTTDSGTSTDQNPSYEFVGLLNEPATFSVTLVVTNAAGVKSEPVIHNVAIKDSSFPTWAIVLITLLSVLVLFLIIFLPLYLLRAK
jgi:PKD repeat protein